MASQTFGEQLRELREAANLSQKKLGELAGIEQNHISSYENGRKYPNLATFNALVAALRLTSKERLDLLALVQ